MKIGLPRELGNGESRVSMTHKGVHKLTKLGHEVFVSKDAGAKSGITDEMYKNSGAVILKDEKDVYEQSDLIVKVKPPVSVELNYLKTGQILFCYMLLEKNQRLICTLLEKNIVGIAYEMVRDEQRRKPLLIPMSEVAGKMAVFKGIEFMQSLHGGKGMMLGSITGLAPSEVVILGAGSVAYKAAEIAMGIGCNITIINKNRTRLRTLNEKLLKKGNYLKLSPESVQNAVIKADLLINTIDLMGDKDTHIVTSQMIKEMKNGSVIIDVACDEGGAIETSKMTNHTDPTYIVDGVIHCAIPNLPGVVPRTATFALADATFPYIIKIANEGVHKVILNDAGLREGLCTYKGHLIHKEASRNFHIPYVPFEKTC
ncbi:alanine dehydrogenase [Crassaminicella profunda]|uniref:alanine dehydrogenase n=1 Tax=Crassaminicella profunda TaxID=1286698 RepID=UPI001CA7735A|nr:alanine dehydrogenase [Crassaminicella profunda]QZY57230.1 alanine dehydrogenase [Crassaminicella profunda]